MEDAQAAPDDFSLPIFVCSHNFNCCSKIGAQVVGVGTWLGGADGGADA